MKVALNDSARALSAELPTLLIDWLTSAAVQASAKARDVCCPDSTGRCNVCCLK